MMPPVPTYVSITFGLTTLLTLVGLYWTIWQSSRETTRKKALPILLGLTGWLALQAVLTTRGVYNSETTSVPPKLFLFGILPAMLLIVSLSVTASGRRFMNSLPLANITYLNTVRILVELVLFWLFLNQAVPQLITFEGRNFDVLSGLTAPFVAYIGLTKGKLSRAVILAWNLICLGLLGNVVVYALLSAPSPLQQFAFDQPNLAITNFPFSWLPTFLVPVVVFGHVVSIRQLSNRAVH